MTDHDLIVFGHEMTHMTAHQTRSCQVWYVNNPDPTAIRVKSRPAFVGRAYRWQQILLSRHSAGRQS